MALTLSAEQIQEIQRLVQVEGKSVDAAADKIGVPSGSVRYMLKNSGYRVRKAWVIEQIPVVILPH